MKLYITTKVVQVLCSCFVTAVIFAHPFESLAQKNSGLLGGISQKKASPADIAGVWNDERGKQYKFQTSENREVTMRIENKNARFIGKYVSEGFTLSAPYIPTSENPIVPLEVQRKFAARYPDLRYRYDLKIIDKNKIQLAYHIIEFTWDKETNVIGGVSEDKIPPQLLVLTRIDDSNDPKPLTNGLTPTEDAEARPTPVEPTRLADPPDSSSSDNDDKGEVFVCRIVVSEKPLRTVYKKARRTEECAKLASAELRRIQNLEKRYNDKLATEKEVAFDTKQDWVKRAESFAKIQKEIQNIIDGDSTPGRTLPVRSETNPASNGALVKVREDLENGTYLETHKTKGGIKVAQFTFNADTSISHAESITKRNPNGTVANSSETYFSKKTAPIESITEYFENDSLGRKYKKMELTFWRNPGRGQQSIQTKKFIWNRNKRKWDEVIYPK